MRILKPFILSLICLLALPAPAVVHAASGATGAGSSSRAHGKPSAKIVKAAKRIKKSKRIKRVKQIKQVKRVKQVKQVKQVEQVKRVEQIKHTRYVKPLRQRTVARSLAASNAPHAASDAPHVARLAALRSSAVVIIDPKTSDVLYQKNPNTVMPIASLTKLMTALVVLEAEQSMTQQLTVTSADVDRLKYSTSRLQVGTTLPRTSMLHLALMSSENRAASALGRNYPGGTRAFVAAMNAKARALGMRNTRYVEPTGLSSANVSTPSDLARLVIAAEKNALIRRYSTDHQFSIRQGRSTSVYHNTNRLTASSNWRIRLQKTGYISEAGRCMVLYTMVNNRPTVMVFLNSQGKYSHAADANRARSWLAGYRNGKVQRTGIRGH